MRKQDVLLRADEVLRDLYDEINTESWGEDEKLYDKQIKDFFIISNMLSELIQYRYNNSMTKEEYKKMANDLIDKFLV